MKNILLILCALAAAAVMGDNILKNGEFNTIRMGHEIYGGGGVGGSKLANVIKPGTENDRCLRVEVAALKTSADGRVELASEITFGKAGDMLGFPAEADTEYEITFDMLGNHQLSLWVSLDSKVITKTYLSEKRIRPTPRVARGSADKWVTHKCVFKTQSNTKFMRIHLILWGDSKQQGTCPFKVGDVIMIDNVKLVKVTK